MCGSLSTSLARCGRPGSVVHHARFGRLCSTLPPSHFWQVERITIGDDPENWRHIGFVVGRDGVVQLRNTTLLLAGTKAGRGILNWQLRPPEQRAQTDKLPASLDGLSTEWLASEVRSGSSSVNPSAVHPNGVTSLDHVVVRTPTPARTFAAFSEALGQDMRGHRVTDKFEMGFFRFEGPLFAEVVGPPPHRDADDATSSPSGGRGGGAPAGSAADVAASTRGMDAATFIGLAFVTQDMSRTQAAFQHLGVNVISEPKDAVQPGRRIASLRHKLLDVSIPTAFMTPHPA